MRRHTIRKLPLLVGLFLLLSSAVSLAGVQARVAVVFSSDKEPYLQAWEGFRRSADEAGISLDVSKYELARRPAPEIIQQVLRQRPDIVVTFGTKATRSAKEAIHDIPIIFCMILHPEEFVAPNITGVLMDVPPGLNLKTLRHVLPDTQKIGVVYSASQSATHADLTQSAGESGFQLIEKEIRSASELTDAISDILWRIDAFMILPDPKIFFPQSVEYVFRESLKNNVPVVGLSSAYTRAGALLSIQYDYRDLGATAGWIAARVLNGESPGTIPPSRPKKITYSLNLRIAEKLGMKFPRRVLKEASEVFGR